MFQSKLHLTPDENELLVLSTQSSKAAPLPTYGIPRSSPRVWKSDFFLTLICLGCFAGALATVFHAKTAISLGQVNQLIALGVLLQVMALCTQKHLQYFMLVCECLWNRSSLQNFESIMQASFVSPNTTLVLRLAILLYLAFPVALGVAYKGFTGGSTTIFDVPHTGRYGWTGQPGTTGLGTRGIALFYNATTPWWTSHQTQGVFGFNLHVESPSRSALLDGPMESDVQQLQSMLGPSESLVLNTLVNATVCDMVFDFGQSKKVDGLERWFYPSSQIRLNRTLALTDQVAAVSQYATDYFNKTSTGASIGVNWSGGPNSLGIVVPPNENGWVWNTTFIMTSRWNKVNESFGACAQGFYLHRRKYNAQWLITRSSIVLNSAARVDNSILPSINDTRLVGAGESSTIEHSYQSVQDEFPRVFVDFDWKYSGDLEAKGTPLPQRQFITSDTTLVVAAVWSRLGVKAGAFNPFANMTDPYQYRLYTSPGTYDKTTPTVKRSPLLAGVLAVNPVVIVVTLVVRLVFLNDAPISKDFGFAALLAGVDKDSLSMVKGAAYSGKLSKSIRITFSALSKTESGDDAVDSVTGSKRRRAGTVTMRLDDTPHAAYSTATSHNRNDRLKRNMVYE